MVDFSRERTVIPRRVMLPKPVERRGGGLVLARKPTQTIVVDGPCVLEVIEVRGQTVRILCDGPESTLFGRGELVEAAENKAA